MKSVHTTVLLQETIQGLNLNEKTTGFVVDATFGGGGHSKEILEKYPNVKVIALDQDKSAWDKAKDKFNLLENRILFVNSNFRNLDKVLEKEGIKEVVGIVYDLGLSSDQLENSGRGFSFMKNEPLLMTMKENPLSEDITAMDVVNNWSEKSLADIIFGYGEEKYSRKIAKSIVEAREKHKIEKTFDLVEIIAKAVPARYRNQRLHFATKTFQAIRIAVNDELGSLTEGLEKGFDALGAGRRMAVISFHSLEDRITKKFFKNELSKAKLINKKIILSTNEEIKNNPRARSAKLRILEKAQTNTGK